MNREAIAALARVPPLAFLWFGPHNGDAGETAVVAGLLIGGLLAFFGTATLADAVARVRRLAPLGRRGPQAIEGCLARGGRVGVRGIITADRVVREPMTGEEVVSYTLAFSTRWLVDGDWKTKSARVAGACSAVFTDGTAFALVDLKGAEFDYDNSETLYAGRLDAMPVALRDPALALFASRIGTITPDDQVTLSRTLVRPHTTLALIGTPEACADVVAVPTGAGSDRQDYRAAVARVAPVARFAAAPGRALVVSSDLDAWRTQAWSDAFRTFRRALWLLLAGTAGALIPWLAVHPT